MKTKFTILNFAIFAMFSILATSFVSAALTIDAPATLNVNHGADTSVSFTFNNTDNVDYTSLDWSGSSTSQTSLGIWKSTSLQSLPISILKNTASPLSAVLTIPRNVKGQFTATLNVKSGGTTLASKTINVNINDSPALTATKIEDLTATKPGKLEIKNDGNLNLNNIGLTQSGAFSVTFSKNNFVLIPGNSETITVTAGDLSGLKFGFNSVSVTAKDSATGAQASAIINQRTTFCKSGNVGGNLSLSRVRLDSTGDDDEEWRLLDTIEVEVEVENNGDEDINDVFVELGLYDSNARDNANDLEFENIDEEKIEIGDIDEGDEETVTFRFKVPADFEDGNYKLAVKAYSDDLGESVECTDTSDDLDNNFFQDISVDREDEEGKFITFDNIEIKPTREATCGDSVTADVDVFNVGDEDQDQVRLNLISSELGLQLEKEIKEDLDQGDKARVSFNFVVPKGLADKLYRLELSADYDYRNGNYRESSDDSTEFTLKVSGCSRIPTEGQGNVALISASLDSGATAGDELAVKATVTNLLDVEADFVVRPTGFDSWASLTSLSEPLIHLNSRETKEVTLKFEVKEDVSGKQSFSLEVRSGDKLEAREIEVDIEGAATEGAPTGSFNLGQNSLIWVIGAINIILIILIIVVAARISKR